MTINSIKLVLLIAASSNLLSCNGQAKSEHKQTEIETLQLGKVVSENYNRIWRIFQDSKSNYWFGSNGNGLYKFDNKTLIQFTTMDGLVHNQIRGIQEDNAGNLYFETPGGISKYDGLVFSTLQPAKSSTSEWKLQSGDLWFGYNANDLYRYDGSFLYELELPRKDLKKAFGVEPEGVSFGRTNENTYAVYGINKDKEGNIWIGTVTAGVYRYDGESLLWFGEKELSTLPDGRVPGVRSMLQDSDGYFWLSNFYSKYRINPDLPKGYEKLIAVDIPTEDTKEKLLYFNAGIADADGNLWMTTYGDGVWKYDGKTLSNFEIKKGEEDVLLMDVFQDSNGTIWLGSDNDGVYQQKGDKFVKFFNNM